MKRRLRTSWLIGITAGLVLMMVVSIMLYINLAGKVSSAARGEKFDSYYVMITEDMDSTFMRSIYESAAKTAKKSNTFVELMGENLSRRFSKEEYMEMAIASSVDGIIVQADESEKMTDLINRAAAGGIPVVTLFNDNTASDRCSFVGISNYNMGCVYGDEINKLLRAKKISKPVVNVTILVNSEVDSGQNLTCTAIRDTVDREIEGNALKCTVEINIVPVDTTNSFSVEESLRNLFITDKEKVPDIIVCLEEEETASCYQAVVDYNKVGTVNILGYFDSQPILKAIERNVINSTVSVNTGQLGEFCVTALDEYHNLGNTSQYFTADLTLINIENVDEYIDIPKDDSAV